MPLTISTRARYGTRLMLELAINYNQGPVILKKIAQLEEISEKYLGTLVLPLKGIGLITSVRGAHGGYMLAKDPSEITIQEIVEVLEGHLCPVRCVENPSVCKRFPTCVMRRVWWKIQERLL